VLDVAGQRKVARCECEEILSAVVLQKTKLCGYTVEKLRGRREQSLGWDLSEIGKASEGSYNRNAEIVEVALEVPRTKTNRPLGQIDRLFPNIDIGKGRKRTDKLDKNGKHLELSSERQK
jgi:hypothetical protein